MNDDLQMARERLAEYIGKYYPAAGLNPTKGRQKIRCMAHDDKNPSMEFYGDKVYCFSCHFSGDIFDLVGLDMGYRSPEAVRQHFPEIKAETFRRLGMASTQDGPGNIIAKARSQYSLKDYFKRRGLSDETASRFGLGYRQVKGEWRAVIPLGDDYFVERPFTTSPGGPKYLTPKGQPRRLFNLKALKAPFVFIVEGEIDAMSIVEAGGAAVGLGSTGGKSKFLALMEKRQDHGFLLLAMDNDEPGRKASAEIGQRLNELGIPYLDATGVYGEFKDANERLVKDRAGFIAALAEIQETAKGERLKAEAARADEYLSSPFRMANILQGFYKSLETPKEYYKTGFPSLDSMLGGGLIGGKLYLLGAPSNMGKTILLQEIADYMALSHDCLIFSMEMAKEDLASRSISRIMFQSPDCKKPLKAHEILAGGQNILGNDWFLLAMGEYDSGAAQRLYIYDEPKTMQDIGSIVRDHVRATGEFPAVFIDYAQIIPPSDITGSMSDKQHMDETTAALRALKHDIPAPVMVVSSFNRESYNSPVTMASFKESGSLEYSADCLMGLQYAYMDEFIKLTGKQADRAAWLFEKRAEADRAAKEGRPVELLLKVLKTRHGCRGAIRLDAYFNYQCIKEPEDGRAFGGEVKTEDIPL